MKKGVHKVYKVIPWVYRRVRKVEKVESLPKNTAIKFSGRYPKATQMVLHVSMCFGCVNQRNLRKHFSEHSVKEVFGLY